MVSEEVENELEVLTSIYGDVLELRPPVWSCPSFCVNIKPTGLPDSEIYARISLLFTLSTSYPAVGPKVDIESSKGLSASDLAEIKQTIKQTTQTNLGEVMCYEIICAVLTCVEKANHKPKTVYEEMLERKDREDVALSQFLAAGAQSEAQSVSRGTGDRGYGGGMSDKPQHQYLLDDVVAAAAAAANAEFLEALSGDPGISIGGSRVDGEAPRASFSEERRRRGGSASAVSTSSGTNMDMAAVSGRESSRKRGGSGGGGSSGSSSSSSGKHSGKTTKSWLVSAYDQAPSVAPSGTTVTNAGNAAGVNIKSGTSSAAPSALPPTPPRYAGEVAAGGGFNALLRSRPNKEPSEPRVGRETEIEAGLRLERIMMPHQQQQTSSTGLFSVLEGSIDSNEVSSTISGSPIVDSNTHTIPVSRAEIIELESGTQCPPYLVDVNQGLADGVQGEHKLSSLLAQASSSFSAPQTTAVDRSTVSPTENKSVAKGGSLVVDEKIVREFAGVISPIETHQVADNNHESPSESDKMENYLPACGKKAPVIQEPGFRLRFTPSNSAQGDFSPSFEVSSLASDTTTTPFSVDPSSIDRSSIQEMPILLDDVEPKHSKQRERMETENTTPEILAQNHVSAVSSAISRPLSPVHTALPSPHLAATISSPPIATVRLLSAPTHSPAQGSSSVSVSDPVPIVVPDPISAPAVPAVIPVAASSSSYSRYKEEFSELKLLGNGASGEVWKVRNRLDRRIYAVKKVKLQQTRSYRYLSYESDGKGGSVSREHLQHPAARVTSFGNLQCRLDSADVRGGGGGMNSKHHQQQSQSARNNNAAGGGSSNRKCARSISREPAARGGSNGGRGGSYSSSENAGRDSNSSAAASGLGSGLGSRSGSAGTAMGSKSRNALNTKIKREVTTISRLLHKHVVRYYAAWIEKEEEEQRVEEIVYLPASTAATAHSASGSQMQGVIRAVGGLRGVEISGADVVRQQSNPFADTSFFPSPQRDPFMDAELADGGDKLYTNSDDNLIENHSFGTGFKLGVDDVVFEDDGVDFEEGDSNSIRDQHVSFGQLDGESSDSTNSGSCADDSSVSRSDTGSGSSRSGSSRGSNSSGSSAESDDSDSFNEDSQSDDSSSDRTKESGSNQGEGAIASSPADKDSGSSDYGNIVFIDDDASPHSSTVATAAATAAGEVSKMQQHKGHLPHETERERNGGDKRMTAAVEGDVELVPHKITKIVTITRSRLYIQMEFCFTTLRTVIDKGSLWREHEVIVSLLRQMLEALAYVHGRRVIHRDLKPANIFLDNDGSIKLGDFGLATSRQRTRSTRSNSTSHRVPSSSGNGLAHVPRVPTSTDQFGFQEDVSTAGQDHLTRSRQDQEQAGSIQPTYLHPYNTLERPAEDVVGKSGEVAEGVGLQETGDLDRTGGAGSSLLSVSFSHMSLMSAADSAGALSVSASDCDWSVLSEGVGTAMYRAPEQEPQQLRKQQYQQQQQQQLPNHQHTKHPLPAGMIGAGKVSPVSLSRTVQKGSEVAGSTGTLDFPHQRRQANRRAVSRPQPHQQSQRRQPQYDSKADMYSLGIILFEMCHKPFDTAMERFITLKNLREHTKLPDPPVNGTSSSSQKTGAVSSGPRSVQIVETSYRNEAGGVGIKGDTWDGGKYTAINTATGTTTEAFTTLSHSFDATDEAKAQQHPYIEIGTKISDAVTSNSSNGNENEKDSENFHVYSLPALRNIILWLVQRNPADRPTALELLSSDCFPSRIDTDALYLRDIARALWKPHSVASATILSVLFHNPLHSASERLGAQTNRGRILVEDAQSSVDKNSLRMVGFGLEGSDITVGSKRGSNGAGGASAGSLVSFAEDLSGQHNHHRLPDVSRLFPDQFDSELLSASFYAVRASLVPSLNLLGALFPVLFNSTATIGSRSNLPSLRASPSLALLLDEVSPSAVTASSGSVSSGNTHSNTGSVALSKINAGSAVLQSFTTSGSIQRILFKPSTKKLSVAALNSLRGYILAQSVVVSAQQMGNAIKKHMREVFELRGAVHFQPSIMRLATSTEEDHTGAQIKRKSSRAGSAARSVDAPSADTEQGLGVGGTGGIGIASSSKRSKLASGSGGTAAGCAGAVRMLDQSGQVISLPGDLLHGYARFAALAELSNAQRYDIGYTYCYPSSAISSTAAGNINATGGAAGGGEIAEIGRNSYGLSHQSDNNSALIDHNKGHPHTRQESDPVDVLLDAQIRAAQAQGENNLISSIPLSHPVMREEAVYDVIVPLDDTDGGNVASSVPGSGTGVRSQSSESSLSAHRQRESSIQNRANLVETTAKAEAEVLLAAFEAIALPATCLPDLALRVNDFRLFPALFGLCSWGDKALSHSMSGGTGMTIKPKSGTGVAQTKESKVVSRTIDAVGTPKFAETQQNILSQNRNEEQKEEQKKEEKEREQVGEFGVSSYSAMDKLLRLLSLCSDCLGSHYSSQRDAVSVSSTSNATSSVPVTALATTSANGEGVTTATSTKSDRAPGGTDKTLNLKTARSAQPGKSFSTTASSGSTVSSRHSCFADLETSYMSELELSSSTVQTFLPFFQILSSQHTHASHRRGSIPSSESAAGAHVGVDSRGAGMGEFGNGGRDGFKRSHHPSLVNEAAVNALDVLKQIEKEYFRIDVVVEVQKLQAAQQGKAFPLSSSSSSSPLAPASSVASDSGIAMNSKKGNSGLVVIRNAANVKSPPRKVASSSVAATSSGVAASSSAKYPKPNSNAAGIAIEADGKDSYASKKDAKKDFFPLKLDSIGVKKVASTSGTVTGLSLSNPPSLLASSAGSRTGSTASSSTVGTSKGNSSAENRALAERFTAEEVFRLRTLMKAFHESITHLRAVLTSLATAPFASHRYPDTTGLTILLDCGLEPLPSSPYAGSFSAALGASQNEAGSVEVAGKSSLYTLPRGMGSGIGRLTGLSTLMRGAEGRPMTYFVLESYFFPSNHQLFKSKDTLSKQQHRASASGASSYTTNTSGISVSKNVSSSVGFSGTGSGGGNVGSSRRQSRESMREAQYTPIEGILKRYKSGDGVIIEIGHFEHSLGSYSQRCFKFGSSFGPTDDISAPGSFKENSHLNARLRSGFSEDSEMSSRVRPVVACGMRVLLNRVMLLLNKFESRQKKVLATAMPSLTLSALSAGGATGTPATASVTAGTSTGSSKLFDVSGAAKFLKNSLESIVENRRDISLSTFSASTRVLVVELSTLPISTGHNSNATINGSDHSRSGEVAESPPLLSVKHTRAVQYALQLLRNLGIAAMPSIHQLLGGFILPISTASSAALKPQDSVKSSSNTSSISSTEFQGLEVASMAARMVDLIGLCVSFRLPVLVAVAGDEVFHSSSARSSPLNVNGHQVHPDSSLAVFVVNCAALTKCNTSSAAFATDLSDRLRKLCLHRSYWEQMQMQHRQELAIQSRERDRLQEFPSFSKQGDLNAAASEVANEGWISSGSLYQLADIVAEYLRDGQQSLFCEIDGHATARVLPSIHSDVHSVASFAPRGETTSGGSSGVAANKKVSVGGLLSGQSGSGKVSSSYKQNTSGAAVISTPAGTRTIFLQLLDSSSDGGPAISSTTGKNYGDVTNRDKRKMRQEKEQIRLKVVEILQDLCGISLLGSSVGNDARNATPRLEVAWKPNGVGQSGIAAVTGVGGSDRTGGMGGGSGGGWYSPGEVIAIDLPLTVVRSITSLFTVHLRGNTVNSNRLSSFVEEYEALLLVGSGPNSSNTSMGGAASLSTGGSTGGGGQNAISSSALGSYGRRMLKQLTQELVRFARQIVSGSNVKYLSSSSAGGSGASNIGGVGGGSSGLLQVYLYSIPDDALDLLSLRAIILDAVAAKLNI